MIRLNESANVEVHPSLITKISSEEVFLNFYNQCSEEIFLMQTTKIAPQRSYVNFYHLVQYYEFNFKLVRLGLNPHLRLALNEFNFQLIYPIYGARLRRIWQKILDLSVQLVVYECQVKENYPDLPRGVRSEIADAMLIRDFSN